MAGRRNAQFRRYPDGTLTLIVVMTLFGVGRLPQVSNSLRQANEIIRDAQDGEPADAESRSIEDQKTAQTAPVAKA